MLKLPGRSRGARPFALLLGFFLFRLLRMAAYGAVDARAAYPAKQILGDAWRIAVWICFPLLWARWLEGRRISELVHPCAPLARNHWPLAVLLCLAMIVAGELHPVAGATDRDLISTPLGQYMRLTRFQA